MNSNRERVIVLTGAGVSAESGLDTFRDAKGLWRGHRPEDVASPVAWARDPQLVLDFYNTRRDAVRAAEPNAAHRAIVDLEQAFDVTVITQNVDDLHERAGSSEVIHLHGEILWARSERDASIRVKLGDRNIELDDAAPDGAQLRPDVVWFGETVPRIDECVRRMGSADRVLVVGTSLSVQPAAGLVRYAHHAHAIALVTQWTDAPVDGIEWYRENATTAVPRIVEGWCAEERSAG